MDHLDLNPHSTQRSLDLEAPAFINLILLLPGHLTTEVGRRRGKTKVRGKGQRIVYMSIVENAPGESCAVKQQHQTWSYRVLEEKTMTADKSEETVKKRTATSNPTGITFTYTSIGHILTRSLEDENSLPPSS